MRTAIYLFLCLVEKSEDCTTVILKFFQGLCSLKLQEHFQGSHLLLEFAVSTSLEYPAYITFYSSDKTLFDSLYQQ